MNARWLLIAVFVLSWTPSAPAQTERIQKLLQSAIEAERGQASASGDTLDLVYLAPTSPVLLRLQFRAGDQSLDKRWEEYVRKWFDFLDRDRNGRLDATELTQAPNTAMMQQIFRQGIFFSNGANALNLRELGKEPQETISAEDLIRHYRKGAGPIQTFGSNTPANAFDQVNEALIKQLDADKDGKISRQEAENAWTVLTKFDLDDDEVVIAQELAPVGQVFGNRGDPKIAMANFQGSFHALTAESPRAPLAALLLAKYDRDRNGRVGKNEMGLLEPTFKRLDLNQDGELDAEELAHWPDRSADYVYDIQLDKAGGTATWSLKKAGSVVPSGLVSLEDIEISVKPSLIAKPPGLARGTFILQQLRLLDKDNRGYLEMKDLQTPQGQFLRQLFPLLDRDADGKLTTKELQAFIDLQAGAISCQITASPSEQGRTLFQLLDANRDGRLSQRELRQAWKKLQTLDRDGDDAVATTEIPRQVQITFGQGQQAFNPQPVVFLGMDPRNPGVPVSRVGPAWFRKMDVNGDGDVSVREFLGRREDFARIDTNNDGPIDAAEAEKMAR